MTESLSNSRTGAWSELEGFGGEHVVARCAAFFLCWIDCEVQ